MTNVDVNLDAGDVKCVVAGEGDYTWLPSKVS